MLDTFIGNFENCTSQISDSIIGLIYVSLFSNCAQLKIGVCMAQECRAAPKLLQIWPPLDVYDLYIIKTKYYHTVGRQWRLLGSQIYPQWI